EVVVDQVAGLDRLRAARLPARPGQGTLDPGGEEAKAERDRDPADHHDPEMGRRVAPQPPDRADVGHDRSPSSRLSSRSISSRSPSLTCSHKAQTTGSEIE